MSRLQKAWLALWIAFAAYFIVFMIVAVNATRTTVDGNTCKYLTVYWNFKTELEGCKP